MTMVSDAPPQEEPKPVHATPHYVQFYIPATTSILERRQRTLKHGDTFGIFDHYGNVVAGDGSPEGLYHNDTRFLSDLRILMNGHRPLLLSSTVQDNNALLTVDLTNPDFVRLGCVSEPDPLVQHECPRQRQVRIAGRAHRHRRTEWCTGHTQCVTLEDHHRLASGPAHAQGSLPDIGLELETGELVARRDGLRLV